MPISVLLIRDLKLGKCLDMDDITSQCKFGEVTGPSLLFMGRSVLNKTAFFGISHIVL